MLCFPVQGGKPSQTDDLMCLHTLLGATTLRLESLPGDSAERVKGYMASIRQLLASGEGRRGCWEPTGSDMEKCRCAA